MRKRIWRLLAWIGAGLLTLIVVAGARVIVWSQVGVLQAETEPLEAVRQNSAITITDDDAGIVLAPRR